LAVEGAVFGASITTFFLGLEPASWFCRLRFLFASAMMMNWTLSSCLAVRLAASNGVGGAFSNPFAVHVHRRKKKKKHGITIAS
jgi:hypothetical protein